MPIFESFSSAYPSFPRKSGNPCSKFLREQLFLARVSHVSQHICHNNYTYWSFIEVKAFVKKRFLSIGYQLRSERGNGLLEFALVLPFMVFMTFGGVEFTSAYQTKHHMAVLSRQILVSINEVCGDANDPSSMPACIENLRTDIDAVLGASFDDWDTRGDFTITVFENSGAGVAAVSGTPKAFHRVSLPSPPHSYVDSVNPPNEITSLLPNTTGSTSTGYVIVAEIFFNYNRIGPLSSVLNNSRMYHRQML